jgi:hypothetical protein
LVGRFDCFADRYLWWRAGVSAYGCYELLQWGVAEELLELVGRFPLVHDQHVALADAESVMQGAGAAASTLGDLCNSAARSVSARRNLSVSPQTLAVMMTLIASS